MKARAVRPPSPVLAVSVAAMALSLLAAFPRVHADPGADPASTAAQMTAAAAQSSGPGLTFSPEVSMSRSRLMPPGTPAVTADGRAMTELAGVDYRLWFSRGRAAVGVGVGALGYVQPPIGLRQDGPVTLVGFTPTLSLGMRYRVSSESALFAHASGSPGLAPDATGGYVSTKVGLEWKPAKSSFGFDHGALGIHLDSGYRLSLKARHDGISIYLRGQF